MKILGINITKRDILGGIWFMKKFMLPLLGVIAVYCAVMIGIFFIMERIRER